MNYKQKIIYLFIGLCLGILVMSFNIKKNNVPLTNGELPIISFLNGSITSNEYYNTLKENSGISILLDLLDDKLLSKKYQLNDKELLTIQEKMNDTINYYIKYYDTNEQDFLNTAGFKDKDTFYNYLIIEEKRKLYEKDYLEKKITNNEINNYYINKLVGDFEIMYIKGDSKILLDILLKLNNGESIQNVLNDKVTYKNLGYISFDNDTINSDIYLDAKNLSENTYTTSLRSIDNEYYIIFKGNVKEKDPLESLKNRITKKIVEEKIKNDTNNLLYKEALINLRKEEQVTFNDTYLEKLYNIFTQ